jgi:hypothetical protein
MWPLEIDIVLRDKSDTIKYTLSHQPKRNHTLLYLVSQ